MSQQLQVRFYKNAPEPKYESNLLSRCYDLFDTVKETLDTHNFLGVPYTSNEEELYDEIEEELGGETDEDGEEFEENIEKELAIRGDFFPISELIKCISAYRGHFQSNASETFDLGYGRNAEGKSIVEDLSALQKELERLPDGKARLTLN